MSRQSCLAPRQKWSANIACANSLEGIMKRIFGLIFVLLISCPELFAREIKFSKNVGEEIVKVLSHDMKLDLSFEDDDRLVRILGIQSLTTESVFQWLFERVQFLVSSKDFPSTEAFSSFLFSNEGAAFYLNRTPRFEFNPRNSEEVEVIKIQSPRVGLIRVNEEILEETVNPSNRFSYASSLFRIANLLHEARHSDGHGLHTGFPHVICPENHRLAGKLACDDNANGPYMVAALFLKSTTRACLREKLCSRTEAAMLKLASLEFFERVVGFRKIDPTPVFQP